MPWLSGLPTILLAFACANVIPAKVTLAEAIAVPACEAASEGILACQAGRACLCRFERASAMTGRPEGFRWDCGILRPACADALPPAERRTAPGGLGEIRIEPVIRPGPR